MDDKLKNELWRKEMGERNKDIKIMLLGILLVVVAIAYYLLYGMYADGSVHWLVPVALTVVGTLTAIVGFFRDKEW